MRFVTPFFLLLAILLAISTSTSGISQADELEPFTPVDSAGVSALRGELTVELKLTDVKLKTLNIPRLSAALRNATWKGTKQSNISVRPEQEYWIVKWSNRPEGADTIVMTFGSKPLLPSETKPITSQTDGSYLLPAHMATAKGEKIRYEPQSYKNTVGYWVGKNDFASWTINVETAGKFNVAILQGCGKGQGGSDARISIFSVESENANAVVDFQVLETGHFQNFQWRTIGVVDLDVGLQELKIEPTKLANKALMDVRAVHLVRLPSPKK